MLPRRERRRRASGRDGPARESFAIGGRAAPSRPLRRRLLMVLLVERGYLLESYIGHYWLTSCVCVPYLGTVTITMHAIVQFDKNAQAAAVACPLVPFCDVVLGCSLLRSLFSSCKQAGAKCRPPRFLNFAANHSTIRHASPLLL